MKTYIALFRGINVGGNHILPMKELVTTLEGLGVRSIKTWIQSGNVVFQSPNANVKQLSQDIPAAIKETHGFAPQVMLIDLVDMESAIASNPFPEGEADPKTLHLFFMDAAPEKPDIESLESLKKDNEQFRLIKNVFYLHAPDGIGRSKLAEKVERSLGVPATARNWRTVSKIMDMANALEKTGAGANPDQAYVMRQFT